jgi:streptogramin lyase
MHHPYQLARKLVWIASSGLLIFMLSACGITSASFTGRNNAKPTSGVTKKSLATATGKIADFPIVTAKRSTVKAGLIAITDGSDGNLWFTETQPSADQGQPDQSLIGRMTPEGKIQTFPLPTTNTLLTGITSGPDGNIWFTESANINTSSASTFYGKIGYITPQGQINEFLLPAVNSDPLMITNGPDGNLWFTDPYTNHIGRISTHGKLSEFPLPQANSFPRGITRGPDGNLWFTEIGKIGRITPTGIIKEFPLAGPYSDPVMITNGPDGNLWFTETTTVLTNISSEIGRITPAGVITIFPVPNSKYFSQGGGGQLYTMVAGPAAITTGPDGNLWFTDVPDRIGHISPDGKNIAELSLPTKKGSSYGIISGADGNLWFTEIVGKIGKIVFRHE